MAKMTAIEWFWIHLPEKISKEYFDLFEQAKEMEKKQIIEAFTKGELVKDNYYDYTNPFNIKGQNYYKKTYENNK